MENLRLPSPAALNARRLSAPKGARSFSSALTALALAWLAATPGLSLQPSPGLTAPDSSAQEPGPQQLVADLAARLFAVLERERVAIRRDPKVVVPRMDELLAPHFDTDYTARLVLGAHWRAATTESRQRFASALYRTLLQTYAGAVSEWTPERFKLLPLTSDASALQVTVRTQVMRAGGSFVPVDYRLHQTAEAWKVFDVIVDGVSYVRTHHDDVDSDVSQKGLEFAIARLEKLGAVAGAHAASVSPDPIRAR